MTNELETLVIRLVGDVDGLVKDLDSANYSVSRLTERVTQGFKEQERAASSLGDAMQSLASGIGTALGALGAKAWLQRAFSEFSEGEAAILQLESAVMANGSAVQDTMQKYVQWANRIQDTTKYGDAQALSLLKMAETFQLTGDVAIKAAEDAVALGNATGRGAEAMIRMAVAVRSGDFEMARRSALRIPQLQGVKDLAQFREKYNKLIQTGNEILAKENKTAVTALKQLNNAYGDLLKDIGRLVADGIRPFVKGMTDSVKWLKSFDDQTKTLIVSIAALTAGVLGLVAAYNLLAPVIAALSGPALPFIAAAVAIGAAIGTWINMMGGVEKAWEAVRQAGMAAWDWLEPITEELYMLWNTVQDAGKFAWQTVMQVALRAWKAIVGDSKISWGQVRDFVLDVLIGIEFGIRNINNIWEAAMAFVAYKSEETWGGIKHFFVASIPAYLKGMVEMFRAAFSAAFKIATDASITLGNILADVTSGNLTSAMSRVKGYLLRTATETVASLKLPPINVPVRIPSDLEKELKKQWEEKRDNLQQSFKDFRDDRLWEIALWGNNRDQNQEEAFQEAEQIGMNMAEKMGRGAASGIKKLDAMIFGSAEALSFIDDYLETLKYGARDGKGGQAADRFAQAINNAGAEEQWETQETLLTKVNDNLTEIRRQGENRIILEGAKFG